MKPFKQPLLKKVTANASHALAPDVVPPPAKRRRISNEADDEIVTTVSRLPAPASTASAKPTGPTREPLVTVPNPPSPERTQKTDDSRQPEAYYMVVWRKFTAKKHKTWDGDGVLAVRGGYAKLYDISGKDLAQKAFSEPLLPGSTLSLGGKDVEVDSTVSKGDFVAGKLFVGSKNMTTASMNTASQPHVQVSVKPTAAPSKPVTSMHAQMRAAMLKEKKDGKASFSAGDQMSKASNLSFKNPQRETTVMAQWANEKPTPRHDPDAPGAIVFRRPKTVPKGQQVVDVVLDPIIGKNLREHQREGVKFLYDCVMGLRHSAGEGCILADEMGLGKTLQTIALLWTLLKQNPIYKASPVIKKALIVCPVTLINNWRKEFKKWLGNERIGVFVMDDTKKRLTDFTMGKSYNVMIIGYERLRTVAEDLTKGSGIDIVIADEGHRLKTEKNKSAQAIQSLNTSKRIILSGTPIQNDLSEFFSMANFVNDGCLGTYKTFMKNFEAPIVRSRQPDALEKDIELGETRSDELTQITSPFILRRTADILSQYLPPKTEYVLFCNPTPDQSNIYRHVVSSPMFQFAMGNSESALQLITVLKKLCNSPSLLQPKAGSDESSSSASLSALVDMLPPGISRSFHSRASSKIRILDHLLHEIRSTTNDKVVLISNYTSTLNLLATLLDSTGLPFLRLDGSTPSNKRQGLVDDFNRSSSQSCFAFLLSAKAGGMGLNLIGGSRLVLFDVDWNPATDDQAMARIHREGQKKHCKIYRFLVKGGLEERIWQRQVVKRGLADSIMDGGSAGAGGGGGGGGKKGVAAFSRDELRDLFRLDEREELKTHDLIGCGCHGKGTSVTAHVADPIKPKTEGTGEQLFFAEDAEIEVVTSDNDDDDDDSSLPDATTLINPPKHPVTRTSQQTSLSTHPNPTNPVKEQQEMQALMEYAHICASPIPSLNPDSPPESAELARLERMLDDPCLLNVLRQGKDVIGGGVAWVFVKTASSDREKRGGEGQGR